MKNHSLPPFGQPNRIQRNHNPDGVDRRGFLECMAWAGTGLVCAFSGGVLGSTALGSARAAESAAADFTFAQISDSHIGFNKEANKDVAGTLRAAVAKIKALPRAPDFILHTGDLTHLAEAEEFDTLDQILKEAGAPVLSVPGEHDILDDHGKKYLERFGKGSLGAGWRSFDHKGVHFVGLVNASDIREGGLGSIGREQLDWLEKDLARLSDGVPVVVYAHIPLWAVFPKWGWGTEDAEQALALLRRFGSVTVLNGHIHQTLQKVEGRVAFHTAMSTAFPQPKPGMAPRPGPMKLPAEKLRASLGVTQVSFVPGTETLAVVDSTLG